MDRDQAILEIRRHQVQIAQARLQAEEQRRLDERDAAAVSLYVFLQQAWRVMEPVTPFVPGPHIEALCIHLEAITRYYVGESDKPIRDLLITVPPGSTKSLTTCVFWPAWSWISWPHLRWLFASYSANLVVRDAVKCRHLIESSWYQERWADRFKFTSDQNVKSRYENDRTGVRISTSVGGGATGEKGDILVIDDPHNVAEVESDPIREGTIRWHDDAFYNRSNDLKRGPHVIIGQRTHHRDLIGHLLKQGGWEHLNIPEEYEKAQHCKTSIGWEDWRSTEGDLLRPERFGPEEVAREKRNNLYKYAAQHQQRPTPRSGGMFKREWFTRVVPAAPRESRRVRYWDKASTLTGCMTCGVLMAIDAQERIYVEDVVRGQWEPFERDRVMLSTAQRDARLYGDYAPTIWVEHEGGSSGIDSAKATARMFMGYPIRFHHPTGNKEVRAEGFSSQAAAGNVILVEGNWIDAYLDSLCLFPKGQFKDDADASSGAFSRLYQPGNRVQGDMVAYPEMPRNGEAPNGDHDGDHGVEAYLPPSQRLDPAALAAETHRYRIDSLDLDLEDRTSEWWER